MLIWNVEVFAEALFVGDKSNEFIRNHIWITVKETNPFQAVDLGQFAKQANNSVRQANVFSVSHRVLRNNHQLANTLFGQAAGFVDKIGKSSATEPAAKTRNRAERAYVITSFGNLQIRHVGRRR